MKFGSLTPFGHRFDPVSLENLGTWDRWVNKMFENMIDPWAGNGHDASLYPSIDVEYKKDGLEVTAELPGVEEKDIKLVLEDNVLVISGEKKRDVEKEEKNYRLMERSYGAFKRTIPLSWSADPSQVEASFENGVLNVYCHRDEGLEEHIKKIPIRSSAQAIGKSSAKRVEKSG